MKEPAALQDSMAHDIGPGGRVSVRVRAGEVRVVGVPGTTARIHTTGNSDHRRLDVEAEEGSISIDARTNSCLEIEVPSDASVRIEAGSADVVARGLHGQQRYRSTSGDIRCEGLQGPVTVDAVSGDVEVVMTGPSSLQARTVSGDLSVRAGAIEAFRAATTSGDLRVAARFEGTGPFAIETVSGDALVAPAGPLRIESSTIAGEIRADVEARVEGSRGRRTVTIGEGGPTMIFRSTSGDLRILPAVDHERPAAPVPPPPPTPPAGPGPQTPASGDGARSDFVPSEQDDDLGLAVLRELEAGVIDVAEAEARLAVIDGAEATRD